MWAAHAVIIQHHRGGIIWIMLLVTGKDTPKHGPWEESKQELTTLAAFEVQFAAQKCTTVCLARDEYLQISPICSMHFDQHAFGLTANLTDKPSAALCRPVILSASFEYSFGNQKITRWEKREKKNHFDLLRYSGSPNSGFSSSDGGTKSPTCVGVDKNAAGWYPWGFQRQHVIVGCFCSRWWLWRDALDHLRGPRASGVGSRVDQGGAGDVGPGRGWNGERQLGTGQWAGRGADAAARFWTWGRGGTKRFIPRHPASPRKTLKLVAC